MSAPKPGTPAYTLAALNLLATNRALVETDLIMARVSAWGGLDLLYRTDAAAQQAAAHLDITAEPRPNPSLRLDGFIRAGAVAGVTVRIESTWPASLAGVA
ncbi:hypothetical protein QUV83_16210 [Cellulomonas cellasea]|uniref:hypothetical protein n=1 Tax=Cellulomonas cellasea TaxID=43670 RepID=UPI0025A314AD|nr:hypothetical protein [Cellulomonas cellasea]MDM8086319.1 hypothetical protein [Cellulomonas cellasea]